MRRQRLQTSPVIQIQHAVRSYQVRKARKFAVARRNYAAAVIQRAVRKHSQKRSAAALVLQSGIRKWQAKLMTMQLRYQADPMVRN